MATARDLIKDALEEIGVIAAGETVSAADAARGLRVLNRMIKSWSIQPLLRFHNKRQEFDLVAGKQIYTIGTSGDFDRANPESITRAAIIDTTHTPNIELPIAIANDDEWARTVLKSLDSTYPMVLHVERSHPLLKIHLWPIPSASYKIALYFDEPLSEIDALDGDVIFPDGYEMAVVLNLAILLAPSFGISVQAETASNAAKSLAMAKRKNSKERLLRIDGALNPHGSTWDWRTGEYR